MPALLAGDVDLAFARLDGELGSAIRSMPLACDKLAVALPAQHRLASAKRVKLASLVDEAFVMFSRRVSPVYFDNVVGACRECGFAPRILHEVRTVASQVAFVGCGQGIALVPSALKRLAPDNVVVRPLADPVDVVTTAVAWNADRENPLVTAALKLLAAGGKGRQGVGNSAA